MLNFLYSAIAQVVLAIHAALSPVFGADSGAAWALSIVLLTIAMRLLLFPLFVKQIRAQRAMQALAPKVKELRDKHKGDKETLNREMMGLYKQHGANPVAGCLPLVLQLPVFFALFRVLDHIKPVLNNGKFSFPSGSVYGIPHDQLVSAANAKVFGAPIAASINSSQHLLNFLGASATNIKVLGALLIVLMGVSTFITQKQMMARTGPVDPAQANIQKIMLYVLPFTFVLFGYRFPIGVLLYWLTTNVWSMGQQFFVIRRMPVAVGGQGGGEGAKPVARPSSPPSGGAKQGLFARLAGAAQAQAEAKAARSDVRTKGTIKGEPAPKNKAPANDKPPQGKGGKDADAAAPAGQRAAPPPPVPLEKKSTGTSGPSPSTSAGSGTGVPRSGKPSQPAVAAVGARRPNTSRAKRKNRRGGRR